jgi:hypothetical protein
MTDPFLKVRCFLPKHEAAKLLTILQQVDEWRAKRAQPQGPSSPAGSGGSGVTSAVIGAP